MNDGNPPSSWYDPPTPKYDLEIKWERTVPAGTRECEKYKCDEEAYMEGAVGDVRHPCGTEFMVCKNHYESLFEDYIEEIESYEPDYNEED